MELLKYHLVNTMRSSKGESVYVKNAHNIRGVSDRRWQDSLSMQYIDNLLSNIDSRCQCLISILLVILYNKKWTFRLLGSLSTLDLWCLLWEFFYLIVFILPILKIKPGIIPHLSDTTRSFCAILWTTSHDESQSHFLRLVPAKTCYPSEYQFTWISITS